MYLTFLVAFEEKGSVEVVESEGGGVDVDETTPDGAGGREEFVKEGVQGNGEEVGRRRGVGQERMSRTKEGEGDYPGL